jgi:hypothetical protein
METNGEVVSIRKGGTPINPENLTFGPPTESYYYGLTGEIREPVSPRPLQPGRKGRSAKAPVHSGPSPENRAAIRKSWKSAQRATERMNQAATTQDFMQLAIAADELDLALAELWKLRVSQDINWQTILNHAQGMMKQAFAEKRVEQLTPDQCAAIGAIVDRHLGTATKSVGDLTEVIDLIEKAGFDPYGAISADPVDDRDQDAPA